MLTDSDLVAQITGPLTGIPVASRAAMYPRPSVKGRCRAVPSARADVTPVKLQAKRKAKSVHQQVEVPASGPGTYRAAEERAPDDSSGTLIRYDVRVEDGLSIDPDKAAVLIQQVLDDKRSWRGTHRWRYELAPVGESATCTPTS